MGTTADKLNYLLGTKTAIKEALVAKGVSVADSDTFRSYADKIGQIQGGGGSQMEYWRVPENYNQIEEEDLIFTVASQMQWKNEGMTIVGSPFLYAVFGLFPSAFSVDMSAFVSNPSDWRLCTVMGFIAQSGIDLEARGYTKITEEEFYAV